MATKSKNGMRKRGNKWYGKFKRAGQWVERALSTDKATAAKMLREFERSADLESVNLGYLSEANPTIASLLAHRMSRFHAKTEMSRRNEEQSCQAMINAIGCTKFKQLTPLRVQKGVDKMRADGISLNSINTKIQRFKTMLETCRKDGLIASNPAAGLRCIPVRPSDLKRPRAKLTKDEAVRLVEAAEERARKWGHVVPQAPFIRTLLATGFRRGECLQLVWSDLGKDCLHLRAEYTKNGYARTNSIPSALSKALKALRELHKREGLGGRDCDPIFLLPLGRRFKGNGGAELGRWFKKLLKQAGIADGHHFKREDGKYVDLHSLRHTYCQWLMEAGVPVQTVAAMMGHRDIKMTLNIYSDADALPQAEAVLALPAL